MKHQSDVIVYDEEVEPWETKANLDDSYFSWSIYHLSVESY